MNDLDALRALQIVIEILANEKRLIEDPNFASEEAEPGAYQRAVVAELEHLVNAVENEGAVLLYYP